MKKLPYLMLLTVFLSGCKVTSEPGGLPTWSMKAAGQVSTTVVDGISHLLQK